jgi:gliding motility-associated-like protein
MKKQLLLFIALSISCCLINNISLAQTHLLPPDQPEQDACGAINLCGNSFFTPYSYQGTGLVLDLSGIPCDPMNGENNSMWMKVTVSTSGTIIFKIIPVDTLDDYDFAVLNTTNISCSSLSVNDVVRADFNNNEPGSNPLGIVGLSDTSSLTCVPGGTFGSPFVESINAVAGQTYLIMINNFGHDDDPGPSSGFTIDFTGSTATFTSAPPPSFSQFDPTCNGTTRITFHLAVPALCSSIAPDGSDFYITPEQVITSAGGGYCSDTIAGYTNAITITFNTPLSPGIYILNAKEGTDGNTLLGICNNELQLPASLAFTVHTAKDTAINQYICFNQLPYTWHGITVTHGGNNVASDTLISSVGCDSIVNLNLTVGNPPAQDSSATTICKGQTFALPWNDTVSIGGIYSHAYLNTLGCDSLISKVALTVDSPSLFSTLIILCGAQPYELPWDTIVNSTGAYTHTYQNTLGCDSLIATWNVRVDTPYTRISRITICGAQSYELPWDTVVNKTDLYQHIYRNTVGCDSMFDEIFLTIDTAVFVNASAIICAGQTYPLPWDSTANSTGIFTHAFQNLAGCDSVISTVNLIVDSPATVVTAMPLCIDSSKILSAGAGFNSYLWNTGAKTPSILIHQQGIYTAIATDSADCVANDTFDIKTDTVVSALPKNFFLCVNNSTVIDAGSGFQSYLWSNDSTTEIININSPGIYWVTVSDSNNCFGTDSIKVVSVPLPDNFLSADSVKCFYSNITLQPNNSFSKYLWSTGATSSSINIMEPGVYSLQVTDGYGCVGEDSISISDSACKEYFYIPNAFTPNGDGKNDIFKPAFAGAVTEYNFIVYNRWGQKIFSSNNVADGWDGTVNGQPQPSGTYVWFCSYQLYQRTSMTQKGTVVLIR